VPLSPLRLRAEALAAGLARPELHAVTYAWRRLPRALQRALAETTQEAPPLSVATPALF